jgi:hypothetical protein
MTNNGTQTRVARATDLQYMRSGQLRACKIWQDLCSHAQTRRLRRVSLTLSIYCSIPIGGRDADPSPSSKTFSARSIREISKSSPSTHNRRRTSPDRPTPQQPEGCAHREKGPILFPTGFIGTPWPANGVVPHFCCIRANPWIVTDAFRQSVGRRWTCDPYRGRRPLLKRDATGS